MITNIYLNILSWATWRSIKRLNIKLGVCLRIFLMILIKRRNNRGAVWIWRKIRVSRRKRKGRRRRRRRKFLMEI